MKQPFEAIKITESVYWVGAIDWDLRDFHGYATERGTTYNAFLIVSDKITLIDTVKPPFKDEMLSRIQSVISPSDIDYIVSNHAEMDHSGLLPEMIELIKPEKVFASARGVQALKNHFHLSYDITPVKEGEKLSLGNKTLQFFETAMLHWPDSMFSFLHEDGILFSQDAFGMHLADHHRWEDLVDPTIIEYEASKYYANILLPYSKLILGLLNRFPSLNLKVNIIAPDHGPLWRKNFDKLFSFYTRWATQSPTNKAIIVYDTMWNSTAKMAEAICEGLIQEGVSTKLMSLKTCHRSNIATEILECGALLVGSPTLNDHLFPTLADCLTYLKGLKRQNLIGAAFGSFGWNGKALDQLNFFLKEMGITSISDGIKIKYVPTSDDLMLCTDLGKFTAQKLKEKLF